MLNVLYDNQVFSWQRVGGISRYFVELMQHFDSSIQVELPLFYSNNLYLDIKNKKSLEFLFSRDFFGKDRLVSFLNNKLVEKKLKQGNFDVFHPTYFDTFFLDYLGEKPFVLTIHDMIPENFPENFPNSNLLVSNKKKLAYSASKIIAISNATKQEVLKHYKDIDENKIEIVYHGSNFSNELKYSKISIPSDFILFVGQRHGYKNFYKFLNAYKAICKSYTSLSLICTGPKFDDEELNLIKEYDLQDKVLHFFTSDNDLKYLYQKAKFFVFPSKEEGFGLPILEAMASNCPIICSNIMCFKEIADTAALYFDYENEESIQEVMLSALKNEDQLKEIVRLGNLKVKEYSWNKSADQLSNIYRKLL